MEKLTSFSKAQQVQKEYALKGTLTNNYLLPDVSKLLIDEGKLFYSKHSKNLYFFEDKGDFYQIYYHLNELDQFFDHFCDKPVMMEILYRGENKKPLEVINYWEASGFKQHIVRENMMATYDKLTLPQSKSKEVVIKIADSINEVTFVQELIVNTFDRFTGDILSFEESVTFMKQHQIICAYYKDQLGGFLQFEIKNNVVWIGHIAVDETFRGKGIANELVKSYITMNKTKPGTRYQLWVMQENKSAIDLYHKFGFIYGNKSSASMLRL